MIWYTSMGLTDFPKIVGAFEKTFPYVKFSTNRLSQSSLMPKIDTEARAGRFAVDVVGSAPVEMWELKQRGYSAAYLSPELKAFPRGFLRSARLLVVDRGDAARARFQYQAGVSGRGAAQLSGSACSRNGKAR